LSPYFFTVGNLSEITLQTAVIGIIAAGQTLVILSGGIDLSVGSVFACSGVAGGLVFQVTGNLWLTSVATLLTGAALGSLNGLFITRLRVPPFIATLGMLGMARGLALILSRGIPIFGLSKEYLWIGQGKLFDLFPVPTLILLAVYGLVFFIARYTRFGRFIYAAGSNAEAAKLSGINLGRVILVTYALSGLFCGVGAMIEAARLGTVQPAGGNGYELLAIGAVVIGGTSLFGGEGNVIATLIGALLETTIRNGLNLLGVNAFWQYVVNGAVIIAAVAVDQWRRRI
jgi:ribose transport system permease protein